MRDVMPEVGERCHIRPSHFIPKNLSVATPGPASGPAGRPITQPQPGSGSVAVAPWTVAAESDGPVTRTWTGPAARPGRVSDAGSCPAGLAPSPSLETLR